MNIRRSRRPDRATAEQMLHGGVRRPDSGVDDLVELLSVAAAPARPDELAGEAAAMAAFRAAHLGHVPQVRRSSMMKSAVAKLLTVKAVAVAIAVTAAGGVALAASSGSLPSPFGGAHDPAPAASANGRPSPGPDHTKGASGQASPSPSLVGLCRAYNAGVAENPGKALENPAFTALITAAGGRDKVSGFCVTVLADADAGAQSQPSRPAHPDPTRTPATPGHPTGKPTSLPTG